MDENFCKMAWGGKKGICFIYFDNKFPAEAFDDVETPTNKSYRRNFELDSYWLLDNKVPRVFESWPKTRFNHFFKLFPELWNHFWFGIMLCIFCTKMKIALEYFLAEKHIYFRPILYILRYFKTMAFQIIDSKVPITYFWFVGTLKKI